ncbi:MAG: bifunctional hydroxymethylpyrimidine kinase/phosphomethylpyrimidine kinase [Actinomycetota bacterium]|nr:bifunctional hydroxymethylpyrimidine kinase/phosphomethylpyrimidine kinase [Actinomycetota bacterium]
MNRVSAFLTVAGSDPSGGAGIQADLKTASALGVYAGAVLTSLTVQNTQGVFGVHQVPAGFVADQLVAVLDDLEVRAVKIGMLGTAEVAHTVADVLLARAEPPQVVLDPVMVSTSGHRLVDDDTVIAIRNRLLPLADVVTPNIPEAATLLGLPVVTDLAAAGGELRTLGARAALVKGGHGDGPTSTDVLVDARGVLELAAPRINTPHTHGTGCTLSSAVGALLVRGLPLRTALREAKAYLTAAMRAGATVRVGHGCGPVDHLYAWSADGAPS